MEIIESNIMNINPFYEAGVEFLQGRKILVTGGTGSLGEAVLRRAENAGWDVEFVVFSRGEAKQSEMKRRFPRHRYVLGDVSRLEDLERAIKGVDVIFHFAAYKQVPAAQANVSTAFTTNIVGSQNVARIAVQHDVEHVVASSTDKASAPINAYGVSKAAMEHLFQEANAWGDTSFTIARYGNVIGSTGSVIPLFIRLMKEKKPITITSREMTRFWITLDQAVDLIVASLMSSDGTVLVPKAPAMSMETLAKGFADLAGTEVQDIGIRPGEKIHESMVHQAESIHTIEYEDFFHIFSPTLVKNGEENSALFEYTSDRPKVTWEWEDMYKVLVAEGLL